MPRNHPEIEPMSVAACRRLLEAAGSSLSDDEVIRLRDQFYAIAQCAVAAFTDWKHEETAALDALPRPEREEIEERAAMFEYDAQLPRAVATRRAVATYVAGAMKGRVIQ